MQTKVFSLFELNQLIRSVIETGFPESIFITAEIASLRTDQRGHCYLELVERDEESIVAQSRGTLWSYNYRIISSQFRSVTGTPLVKGLRILFEAKVTYHERYGLSLNIQDIDPTYTLGEMAKRRREILERLTKEGLLEKNKEVEFPVLPLNLAVISSPKAAGYEDFLNHIEHNPHGYALKVQLFSALMQGDNAEASIVDALSRCHAKIDRFDVLVIIRGGGGEADLHCFDSYEIGKAIAMLPVPVISGIGHFRDRTVVDEVSHTTVKTPTAAAEILIRTVRDFHLRIVDLEARLVESSRETIENGTDALYRLSADMEKHVTRFLTVEEVRLSNFGKSLSYSGRIISKNIQRMSNLQNTFSSHIRNRIRENSINLEHTKVLIRTHLKAYLYYMKAALRDRENNIRHLNPLNVLRRGYSITYKGSGLIKDIQNVKSGDIIMTILFNGTIRSSITEVEGNGEEETAEI